MPGEYKISFIVFGLRECHIWLWKETEKKKKKGGKPIGGPVPNEVLLLTWS